MKGKKESLGPSPILIWIMVFVLIVALFFLVNSSLFYVTSITVKGNVTFSEQEIITLSGLSFDQNILHVDEVQIKENIEQNVMLVVKDIKRTFPTGVEITVEERVPAAQIGTANGYYVVDSNGIALTLFPARSKGLTVVSGIRMQEPVFGQQIIAESDEKLTSLVRVLEAMETYKLEDKILGIDLSDPHRIELTYEGDIMIRLAGASSVMDRFRYLKATVEAVKDKLKDGQYINMESEGGYYLG